MSAKNGQYVPCLNCGTIIYKQAWFLKEHKPFCCSKCHDEYRHKTRIKELEQKINCDLGQWLEHEYINNKRSTTQIRKELGVQTHTILKLLKEYGIETRNFSEAVKLDWKGNDNKREQIRIHAITKLNIKESRDKLRMIMQTKEYKLKMSRANKGSNNGMYGRYGTLNPSYNPNIPPEERINRRFIDGYSTWRQAVYERDNYTCQCCGDKKGHNLVAHHLYNYKDYPKLRLDVSNGITLCDKCHKKFHKLYGSRHNTKEQYIEMLKTTTEALA